MMHRILIAFAILTITACSPWQLSRRDLGRTLAQVKPRSRPCGAFIHGGRSIALGILIYRDGHGVHRVRRRELGISTLGATEEQLDRVDQCLADALDSLRYPRFRGPRMEIGYPLYLLNEPELQAARERLASAMASHDRASATAAAAAIMSVYADDPEAWYARGLAACEDHDRQALRAALVVLPGLARLRLREACKGHWRETLGESDD